MNTESWRAPAWKVERHRIAVWLAGTRATFPRCAETPAHVRFYVQNWMLSRVGVGPESMARLVR